MRADNERERDEILARLTDTASRLSEVTTAHAAELERVRADAARERDELRGALESRAQVLEESRGELRGRAERAERDLDAARAELARIRQGDAGQRTPPGVNRGGAKAASCRLSSLPLESHQSGRTGIPFPARRSWHIFRPPGAVEVDVPGEGRVGEVRAGKVRVAEVRAGEVRRQVRRRSRGQVCAGEVRVGEIAARRARSAPARSRAGEVRAGEVRAGKVDPPNVAVAIPAPDHGNGGLNVGPCRSLSSRPPESAAATARANARG